MGRRKKEIKENQLRQMCAYYASMAECAEFFGVSHDTINARCKEWGYPDFPSFREASLNKTRFMLKRQLVTRATKSDKLLIYALENICGMHKERAEHRASLMQPSPPQDVVPSTAINIKSFQDFIKDAKYPAPLDKQLEMAKFSIQGEGARLLLGSRGYGKTDYLTILGVAYDVYRDYITGTPMLSWLIVTKSRERNKSILDEIGKALEANGVELEIYNSTAIRVKGLHGKDDSVSAITIKSTSLRGRHPKKVIMDDPVTDDDTSEATRKRVKKTYEELYKVCPNICIIGQPVHKADLYQELRNIVDKMEVPHGTILELDHDLEAQRLAGISEESISCSYHLIVRSENPSPFDSVNFLPNFTRDDSVAFIDPSFEGGDYTALSIGKGHFNGVAIKGRVWKRAWNICLEEIVQELVRCGVKRVCFETNSLGDMPVMMLREQLKNTGIGVVGKKSIKEKHSRIMNAGMFAKSIYISQDSDKLYIDQVTQYEYGSKFDDAPDSLANLLEWIGLIKGK